MKKLILLSAVLLGTAVASQAGVHVDVGFGLPFPPIPLPGRVIISHPAPVYVQPQHCAPPPRVYCPPPRYYSYPSHGYGHSSSGHYGGHSSHHSSHSDWNGNRGHSSHHGGHR